MTTYNRYKGGSTAYHAAAPSKQRQPSVLEAIIDFSTTGNTNAAADVFNVLEVPAGYAVLATELEVLKADTAGNSGTVTLRLATTARGTAQAPVAAQCDNSAVPGYLTTGTSSTYIKPLSTNQILNILVSTGAINATVRVAAVVVPLVSGGGAVNTGSGTFTQLDSSLSFVSKAP